MGELHLKPELVGLESEDRYIDVERGQLRLFAKATRERNPVYTDVEAARAAGYPDLPVPPTFAFCLTTLAPSKIGNMEDMIIMGKSLHGEQSFEYNTMMFAGDRILIKARVTDVYAKNGGALEFLVQETECWNQQGELCVVSRQSAVVVHS